MLLFEVRLKRQVRYVSVTLDQVTCDDFANQIQMLTEDASRIWLMPQLDANSELARPHCFKHSKHYGSQTAGNISAADFSMKVLKACSLTQYLSLLKE